MSHQLISVLMRYIAAYSEETSAESTVI